MLTKSKVVVVSLLVVLGLGLAVGVITTHSAMAQDSKEVAPTLGEMLNAGLERKYSLTIEFVIPLITGERVWTLPDAKAKRNISVVGTDYMCFSEPWNDGVRQRCTPFTNIASFTYLTGQ